MRKSRTKKGREKAGFCLPQITLKEAWAIDTVLSPPCTCIGCEDDVIRRCAEEFVRARKINLDLYKPHYGLGAKASPDAQL